MNPMQDLVQPIDFETEDAIQKGFRSIRGVVYGLPRIARKWSKAPERLREKGAAYMRRAGKRKPEHRMGIAEEALEQSQKITGRRKKLKMGGVALAAGGGGYEAGKQRNPNLQYEDIVDAVRELEKPRMRKFKRSFKGSLKRLQRLYEAPERIRGYQLREASRGNWKAVKEWEKKRQKAQNKRTGLEVGSVGASVAGLGYKASQMNKAKELKIRDINAKKREEKILNLSEKERRKLYLKRHGIETMMDMHRALQRERGEI